jgi:hypothetical protein
VFGLSFRARRPSGLPYLLEMLETVHIGGIVAAPPLFKNFDVFCLQPILIIFLLYIFHFIEIMQYKYFHVSA